MKTNVSKRVSAYIIGFLVSIFTLFACAPKKPLSSASEYRFNFNNETYRIRSISSGDKMKAHNELIGPNLSAADFDQDRVIDRILFGEVGLEEAQEIYEYGLNMAAKESKLRVRIPPGVNRYLHESNDLQIEISSFRPANERPFNEFKIIDKRRVIYPEVIIIVDQNADGTLDQVLKGTAVLEEVQPQYDEAIRKGLQKGELVKINNTILVKEK